MIRGGLALAGLISIILAGCGGGGGSTTTDNSNSAATKIIPKPVPYTGNSTTYTRTDTDSNGVKTTVSYTRAYSVVNPDRSSIRVDTYGNNTPAITNVLDPDFGTLSTSSSLQNCTFTPRSIGSSFPSSVGQAWDNSFTGNCTSNGVTSTLQIRNNGSTTAAESLTTPAGTFDAGKQVYTVTTTRSGTGGYTQVVQNTCWFDMWNGRVLRCDYNTTYTPVSGAVLTTSGTFAAIGYVSAVGQSVLVTQRFAGNWAGSFTGSDSGICSNITVSDTGTVNGTCSAASVGTFAISGNIAADGTANFTASTGAIFTGTASTISASGTWSMTNGATGTWSATHQ